MYKEEYDERVNAVASMLKKALFGEMETFIYLTPPEEENAVETVADDDDIVFKRKRKASPDSKGEVNTHNRKIIIG